MKAHEVLTLFARLVQPTTPSAGSPSPQSLCEASVTIAAASGGAMVVDYADATRMILFATDRRAHRLEDLQEVLGEGPGWEAYRTSEATSCDLGTTTRWPLFAGTAVEEVGAVRLAAAPIHAAGSAVGVLSMYWADPPLGQAGHSRAGGGAPGHRTPAAGWDPGLEGLEGLEGSDGFEEADLLDLMGLLGNLVGAFLATASDQEWEANLPWSQRASIHQATGMLAAQLQLSVDNAAAALRAYAFSSGRDLHGAASDVLHHRITLQLPQHDQESS